MRQTWARIEAVLRATAPDQLAALAPGATAEVIQAAETSLGVALPPDVRESYTVHNGSGAVDVLSSELYGLIAVPLHSLDELVREWQLWQEWGRGGNDRHTSPQGPVKADRYNPRWLPVTWDGGSVNLCIDLDPAPGGVHGQLIYLDHLDPQRVADDGWRVFLERYAEQLELGRMRFEGGDLIAAAEDVEYTAALRSLIAEGRNAAPGT